MVSYKMIDGSRYEAEEHVRDEDGWPVVTGDKETIYLNPWHIVSITIKGEGG